MARVHDRRVNHHVVVDELRGSRAVCENAANCASNEVDSLRAIRLEPLVDRCLIAEIELIARGSERRDPVLLQAPDDGRADESTMACDEHLWIGAFRQYPAPLSQTTELDPLKPRHRHPEQNGAVVKTPDVRGAVRSRPVVHRNVDYTGTSTAAGKSSSKSPKGSKSPKSLRHRTNRS